MLKPDDLAKQIKGSLESIIPGALETCLKNFQPTQSDAMDAKIDDFVATFKSLVCEDLANSLASAIDYYIKCADITGMLITTGSPFTQQVTISPPPMPAIGGKLPNTLGIA